MRFINSQSFSRVKNTNSLPNEIKLKFLACFSFILFVISFLFNSPNEIFEGMKIIILSPSHLITDYFEISNFGATFFNAGLMTSIYLIIFKKNKTNISGPIIAAFFTVCGFSFFGKNLYNSIPIILGVYIYSRIESLKFNKVIIISMFSTGLSPMVSFITFSIGLKPINGFLIAWLVGIIIGIIMPPLASSFLSFHQGFNLYNAGFTAGIVGMFLTGFLRMFDKTVTNRNIISSGNNVILSILLFIFFILVFIIGFYLNGYSFSKYKSILSTTGRLITDFEMIYGTGITLINMSIMGVIATIYVLLCGAELNGPVLGGIFTVFGFATFGNHPKNSIPILIGVYIAHFFGTYDNTSTSAMLTALFGTTIAPIAGDFGPIWGIIAGFFHSSMVMNIAYLHGGTNLYNNGFSGGFIAATMVPIINSYNNFMEGLKR